MIVGEEQTPAYSAIFFDIDDTLVDSNDGHILAWQEAFEGPALASLMRRSMRK